MAIERGVDWGRPGQLPAAAPVASSDREAAAFYDRGQKVIGVRAGDLARTLGVRESFTADKAAQLLPVDVLRVALDGGSELTAVAHVSIGRWLSSGFTLIMNAAFVGDRNAAPRAHPGDGKANIVSFEMNLIDRVKARSRMRNGSHIPHPGVGLKRVSDGLLTFKSSQRVALDGVAVGRARSVAFRIEPEALTVGV